MKIFATQAALTAAVLHRRHTTYTSPYHTSHVHIQLFCATLDNYCVPSHFQASI